MQSKRTVFEGLIVSSTILLFTTLYFINAFEYAFPIWDGASYLENAKDLLLGLPLYEKFRPQLISFITAIIWSIIGINWGVIRVLSPIFFSLAITLIYLSLRDENKILAYLTIIFTSICPVIIEWTPHILVHALALLMVSLTYYSLIKDKWWSPYLAGLACGLTFMARYPIVVIPASMIIFYMFVDKRYRESILSVLIASFLISTYVMWMTSREGVFLLGLAKDVSLKITDLRFSFYYLENGDKIWGPIFIFSIFSAFYIIFRDGSRAAKLMLIWTVAPFLLWSIHPTNLNMRFTYEFAPAVVYLGLYFMFRALKKTRLAFSSKKKRFSHIIGGVLMLFTISLTLISTAQLGVLKFHDQLTKEMWIKDENMLKVAEAVRRLPGDRIVVSSFATMLKFFSDKDVYINWGGDGSISTLKEYVYRRVHADYLVVFLGLAANPPDQAIFSNKDLLISAFGEPILELEAQHVPVLFFNTSRRG